MTDVSGSASAGNPADGGGAAAAGSQAAAGGQQQQAQQPWYSTIKNEETKGWFANKNFPDLDATAESYRNLEKLLGSDSRVILPKDPADKAGWDKVWNQLGRPEAADKYKFPVPEGYEANKELIGGFSKIAHEAGITQAQAETVFKWYMEAEKAQQSQASVSSETDLNTLKGEWGAAYDQKIELGKRAAREFGVDAATLEKIEGAVGTGTLLKMFANIGSKLGEHKIEGDAPTGFGKTPEQAHAEISRLQGDTQFMQRYMSEDPKVRESAILEMTRLHKLAQGEAA
jgi:hypothetical protein